MRKNIIVFILFISALIKLNAQVVDWQWAQGGHGSYTDVGQCIAADNHGNAFAAGYFFSQSLSFGSYTVQKSSTYSNFLVKFNGSGNALWAYSAKCSAGGLTYANGVTTDIAGNVFITGRFDGAKIIFGNDTLFNINSSGSDLYLAKLDSNGNILWAKNAGGNNDVYGFDVATDLYGNTCVTGFFGGPYISFGSDTLFNINTSSEVYIAKYDPNGNFLWARSARGSGQDRGESVIMDSDGNSYLAGNFWSPYITFGNDTLFNTSPHDVFIVKYDESGDILWTTKSIGRGYECSIAIDSIDNIYIGGTFDGNSITFGSITLNNVAGSSTSNLFLVKYDTTGNSVWAKGVGPCNLAGVVTIKNGNTYIGGSFGGNISFDSYPLNSSSTDVFVAGYDSYGNALWAKSAGGSSMDRGYGIAVDQSNVFVTGGYESSQMNFGTFFITNTGSTDVFVAKLGDIITGVGDILNDKLQINVYPNPAQDELSIEYSNSEDNCEVVIFEIYNSLGEKVAESSIKSGQTTVISTVSLVQGVYLYRFVSKKIISGATKLMIIK
jgi:hypothetical protein